MKANAFCKDHRRTGKEASGVWILKYTIRWSPGDNFASKFQLCLAMLPPLHFRQEVLAVCHWLVTPLPFGKIDIIIVSVLAGQVLFPLTASVPYW